MKKNQASLLIAIVASGIFYCQNLQAQTLLPYLVESFNYSGTGNLAADANSGNTGGVPGWNTSNSQITITNGSDSLVGTNLGLLASTGGKVYISGITNGVSSFANNSTYNKFVNPLQIPPTANPPTNVVYYSFLYQFNVGTDVPATGVMITGVNRENSGFTSTATFHWRLIAKNVGGSTVQLGITKAIDATGVNLQTNYASTNILVGQTYFIVISSAITNGQPETENLWINPPAGSFGAAEGSLPPPSATTTNGVDDSSGTGQGRFHIAISGCAANLDELRIAPTWALATPAFGSCSSAFITTDLTNKTQSAEISTTFSVAAALTTSPIYQWQRNSNSVATVWTNIPGAILSSYTTPNLVFATDNGSKYRVIVTAPCDLSSVTSSVSTLTLTAPIVTPNGLVMDDNFSDTFRGNTPVTTNNSVWFTSVTADLDATSGSMIALPISGTSSLWLGYFVDESTTSLPVDLDVGKTIKVTLPFTLGDFSSGFTNNGALRFGLFDYADGGTLITADSASPPNAVTGSTGNGLNVRGYMLSLDFGTNFTASSPLSLLVRNGLGDNNLMGTTADYVSMQSGPSGGGYSNAPAFMPNTSYTLVFSVTRSTVNACSVAATISGGGTNWMFASTDTNGFGYHRFDAFAIRPNQLENFASMVTIPEFKVEVLDGLLVTTSITTTNVSLSGNNVILNWNPTIGFRAAGTTTFSVLSKTNLTDASWFTNATGISSTSYTDTLSSASTRFYRVSSP